MVPDLEPIKSAYLYDMSKVDRMYYRDNENIKTDWKIVANDFVLQNDKLKIKKFIKIVHEVKVEVERKMKFDLDTKILSMRSERLYQTLGKKFIARIKSYIRKLYSGKDLKNNAKYNI